MRRVVERCPSCGVEHDHVADGCEACGSALRYWCRTHSREIGWLDGDECPRCPPGLGRATPRPAAAAPPPPPPAHPAASPAKWRRTMAAPPPAARVAEPSPAPAAVPTPPPVAVSTVPAPAPEPVGEAEDRAPQEVRRPGLFSAVFEGVLTMLQTGITGTLLGMGAGGFYAYYLGADIPATAIEWGVYGALLGLLLGSLLPALLVAAWFRSRRGP